MGCGHTCKDHIVIMHSKLLQGNLANMNFSNRPLLAFGYSDDIYGLWVFALHIIVAVNYCLIKLNIYVPVYMNFLKVIH